jgi:hypothetical protein
VLQSGSEDVDSLMMWQGTFGMNEGSEITLRIVGGLLLNALLGWWWADPVAALAMVPIIAKEGVEGLGASVYCSENWRYSGEPGGTRMPVRH